VRRQPSSSARSGKGVEWAMGFQYTVKHVK